MTIRLNVKKVSVFALRRATIASESNVISCSNTIRYHKCNRIEAFRICVQHCVLRYNNFVKVNSGWQRVMLKICCKALQIRILES